MPPHSRERGASLPSVHGRRQMATCASRQRRHAWVSVPTQAVTWTLSGLLGCNGTHRGWSLSRRAALLARQCQRTADRKAASGSTSISPSVVRWQRGVCWPSAKSLPCASETAGDAWTSDPGLGSGHTSGRPQLGLVRHVSALWLRYLNNSFEFSVPECGRVPPCGTFNLSARALLILIAFRVRQAQWWPPGSCGLLPPPRPTRRLRRRLSPPPLPRVAADPRPGGLRRRRRRAAAGEAAGAPARAWQRFSSSASSNLGGGGSGGGGGARSFAMEEYIASRPLTRARFFQPPASSTCFAAPRDFVVPSTPRCHPRRLRSL